MPRLLNLAETIDQIEACLALTDAEIALILGVQPRTIDRWRSEQAFPQHESRLRLHALGALAERLEHSFTSPAGATAWLHAESGYFGGLKPIDALLRGRIDLVDAALDAIESGIFV